MANPSTVRGDASSGDSKAGLSRGGINIKLVVRFHIIETAYHKTS
jgi:hypothetical protein